MHTRYLIIAALLATPTIVAADTVEQTLADYRSQGAETFDAGRGSAMWKQAFSADDGKPRSCTTCHGEDPTQPGRHARTGKVIQPMAPSINPQRLTRRKTIDKWLLRNCKWTLGRECTAQEKGDFLVFLHRL